MTTATITPTLHLGDPEEADVLHDLLPVKDANEAVAVIVGGYSALLPSGAWEEARLVLKAFGCTDEWIESLFHYAKTGEARL